jgi:hypothetical protein
MVHDAIHHWTPPQPESSVSGHCVNLASWELGMQQGLTKQILVPVLDKSNNSIKRMITAAQIWPLSLAYYISLANFRG